MKASLIAVLIVLLCSIILILNTDEVVHQVVSGDKSLYCEMKDGYRKIDPSLIVDFEDGHWIFKNGSAKNCEVR